MLSVVAFLLPSVSLAAVKLPSVPVQILHTDGKTSSFGIASANAGSGASLAVADLGTDGRSEIIIGTGLGNAPEVLVLRQDGTEIGRFLAYAPTTGVGMNISVCDLDGDQIKEIITSPQRGGGPHVRIFSNTGTLKWGNGFFAYDPSTRFGVDISCGDITGDGHNELVTKEALGGTPLIKVWQVVQDNTSSLKELQKFDEQAARLLLSASAPVDGKHVIKADLDGDGGFESVSVPARPEFNALETAERSIVIDISEQRLYAYEKGILANTFFVSTGKAPFKTPLGTHSVLAKVPFVHYKGIGYDLGVIPWNLRIYPHIYIHYAPWHNNFGTPMSHGCVNVNLTNIKWIYHWADVGVPVTVQL